MTVDVAPLSIVSAQPVFERSPLRVDGIDFDAETVTYSLVPAEVTPQCATGLGALIDHDGSADLLSSTGRTECDGEDGLEEGADAGPSPYLDYERRFTPEGGVALTYKTVDDSLWRLLLRVALWAMFLGMVATYALRHSPYPALPLWCPIAGPCRGQPPLMPLLLNLAALGGMALVSFLILFPEDQCLREIEIRPDCLILDGTDLFWREHFTIACPSFGPGEDGMLVLRGTYGTRQVEFLSLKAFDEHDQAPQVLAAQIQAAFQQLWTHFPAPSNFC